MAKFIFGCSFVFLLMLGAVWTSGTRFGVVYAIFVALLLLLMMRPDRS